MTVGSRSAQVSCERLRLRAHYGDAHLRGKLHYSVQPPHKLVKRRNHFTSTLGQMLITYAVVLQSAGEVAGVILRPARPRHAAHVTQEGDLVLAEQLKKKLERMAAMAYRVNSTICHKNIYYNIF